MQNETGGGRVKSIHESQEMESCSAWSWSGRT